jgi:toxin CptA
MKFAPAIAFDYRPSRWLGLAVGGVAFLACVAVALSGMPWWTKLAAAIAACCYAAHSLRRFWLVSVRRVAWHEAGHWRIAEADGAEHVAELEHAVVRGAWIVLRLQRSDGERLVLILGPDNSDADVRRRLRVRLARVRDDAGPAA